MVCPTAGLVAYVSNDGVAVSIGWKHLYQLAWPACFVLSAVVYYALCWVSRPAGLGERDVKGDDEKEFTSRTPTIVEPATETLDSQQKV